MMFILIWVTMILGIVADFMSDILMYLDPSAYAEEPLLGILGFWVWLVPHCSAWITCFAAYIPVIDMFTSSSNESETKAPGFVHVIIYLQASLFCCFGIVQLYYLVMRTWTLQSKEMHVSLEFIEQSGDEVQQLMRAGGYKQLQLKIIMENAERSYIVLSFVAKTLLAWLILSPLIANASKDSPI
jgi:hypothetical protein